MTRLGVSSDVTLFKFNLFALIILNSLIIIDMWRVLHGFEMMKRAINFSDPYNFEVLVHFFETEKSVHHN